MRNEKAKDVRFLLYCILNVENFRMNITLAAEGTKVVPPFWNYSAESLQFCSSPVTNPDYAFESDVSFESFSWPNFFMTYAKYSKTPLSRSGSVSTVRSQSSRASNGFIKCGCRGLMYRKVPPGTNTRTTSRRYRSMFSRTSSGGSHTEPWNLYVWWRSASANQW